MRLNYWIPCLGADLTTLLWRMSSDCMTGLTLEFQFWAIISRNGWLSIAFYTIRSRYLRIHAQQRIDGRLSPDNINALQHGIEAFAFLPGYRVLYFCAQMTT